MVQVVYFYGFDLTGACLSSKVLSVVWYCSRNCDIDKSALELVISSDAIIKCKNANAVSIPIKYITLRLCLNCISAVIVK